MIFEAPEATSNKTPWVSAPFFVCAHQRFSPKIGRIQKLIRPTRIQKRAVGILENTQTKSAIAVEKDTVPLASWEGKAGYHLEGYPLEDSVEMGRKPNFRNTSLVSELPWISETTMTKTQCHELSRWKRAKKYIQT